jgi:hypothetical protein
MTLIIRSSPKRWKKTPGSVDSLHVSELYNSDNNFGIPVIGNEGNIRPENLHPYNCRTKSQAIQKSSALHFFLDDYQIEGAWTIYRRTVPYIAKFSWAITPDFSFWSHWPPVLQWFNLYRSRWVGAWWMTNGITVIPSVSWSGDYDHEFLGIKQGSTIAISTVGVKGKEAIKEHCEGFWAMIEAVKPSNILIYGHAITGKNQIDIREYKTFWEIRTLERLAQQ